MEKKNKDVLLLIMGILILAELASTIFVANSQNMLITICEIISLTFITLYGFWLYKKPHGNMLKYAMVLVAVSQLLSAAQCIQFGYGKFYVLTVWLIVAAIIIYVAGRLDRIEQNKKLLTVAAIAMLIITFVAIFTTTGNVTLLRKLSWFNYSISIITLMIAYFVRYDEHKEAGVSDK